MTTYISVDEIPDPDDEPSPLAVFEVDGEKVTPFYFDDRFEQEVKDGLVLDGEDGVALLPESPGFIDWLKKMFQQSTKISVTESDTKPTGDGISDEDLSEAAKFPNTPEGDEAFMSSLGTDEAE